MGVRQVVRKEMQTTGLKDREFHARVLSPLMGTRRHPIQTGAAFEWALEQKRQTGPVFVRNASCGTVICLPDTDLPVPFCRNGVQRFISDDV